MSSERAPVIIEGVMEDEEDKIQVSYYKFEVTFTSLFFFLPTFYVCIHFINKLVLVIYTFI